MIEHFTQKIVTKLSKIWVWDPGSGIRIKDPANPIPDPRSRIQGSKRHRIPESQHWTKVQSLLCFGRGSFFNMHRAPIIHNF
jgi:hypothetical protein